MPMLCMQNGQKNGIGKKLKRLRMKSGMTQRDLAEKFRENGYPISQKKISQIERKTRHVKISEIFAIMDVFQIPSSVLFEENEIDQM